uniref:Uncharacterized protein n=1 Tax=Setaria italica TaxID=4555 RepID=K3XNY4_SETIT
MVAPCCCEDEDTGQQRCVPVSAAVARRRHGEGYWLVGNGRAGSALHPQAAGTTPTPRPAPASDGRCGRRQRRCIS